VLPDDYRPPVTESQELKDEICSRIENGETLRSICREDGKPHFTSVYDWMKKDELFALRFACAREAGHDAIAEDCLRIADESGADAVVDDKTGGLKVDGEVIRFKMWNGSRLYVNQRGWTLGFFSIQMFDIPAAGYPEMALLEGDKPSPKVARAVSELLKINEYRMVEV